MASLGVKLTKKAVDGALAKDERYIVWDNELKGFGIRIEASGTKTYLVRYRPRGQGSGAPKRFVVIGRHGPLTADMARNEALRLLGAVARGEDPAMKIAKDRSSLTISRAAHVFLDEHVKLKRKASTTADYTSVLTGHVIPKLGALKADQVKRADIAKLHKAMAASPYQANRMLAVVGSMYGFLEKFGHVPEGINPAKGVERYREQSRERYLTKEELSRLGHALREAETDGIPWSLQPGSMLSKHLPKPEHRRTVADPNATAAIRLLILTGARLREILRLRWDEVDLERGLAFLADSKTGRKTLVLSSAAVLLLRNLPKTDTFVIKGAKPGYARADLKKPWAAIQRRAQLENVRLHDLRHTFASIGAGASLGLPIVGKLLGHSQPQTTARYAHLDADPLRRAADVIGNLLIASLNLPAEQDVSE